MYLSGGEGRSEGATLVLTTAGPVHGSKNVWGSILTRPLISSLSCLFEHCVTVSMFN